MIFVVMYVLVLNVCWGVRCGSEWLMVDFPWYYGRTVFVRVYFYP